MVYGDYQRTPNAGVSKCPKGHNVIPVPVVCQGDIGTRRGRGMVTGGCGLGGLGRPGDR
jgi:hypothetical protein